MSLVAYTVDSDSDNESVTYEEQEVKVKLEPVEFSAEQTVTDILQEILSSVFTSSRDFSDMYIKEEPLDEEVEVKEEIFADYRTQVKVEIETDSDDSSDEEDSPANIKVEDVKEENEAIREGPRSKNELRLRDLPPVEELNVSVGADEAVKIGVVSSCVEELVVVESMPGNPALDLDSVLFLDSGSRVLGRVFDVIGPVQRPYYCVRFNTADDIKQKGIERGEDVYYAPKSGLTTFVFLEQLMKLKISDASWKDDEEPPPDFLEYSDDEQERAAKQQRTINKMIESGATEEDIRRKRAKFGGNRKRHSEDGNEHYNSQRHDNGLYRPTVNPFYRQTRRYNPGATAGQVTWNNFNAGGQQQGQSFDNNRGYYTDQRQNQNFHNGNVEYNQQQYSPHQTSSYGYQTSGNNSGQNQHHSQYYHNNPSRNEGNIRWSHHQYAQPPPPPPR